MGLGAIHSVRGRTGLEPEVGVENSGLACRDCRGVDIRKLPHLAGRGASQTEIGVITKILALGFQGKRRQKTLSAMFTSFAGQSVSIFELYNLLPKP